MSAEPDSSLAFASAVSRRADTAAAASEVCDRALARLGDRGTPDLAFVFLTAEHVPRAVDLDRIVHERLGVETLVAVSAEGVLGDSVEIERAAGVAVLAGIMPGVECKPFLIQDFPKPPVSADDEWAAAVLGPIIGAGPELRGTIVFTDPFSVPLVRLLPLMNRARGEDAGPLLGAVASAAAVPGQNVLSINGGIMNAGGVGVSLRGDIEVDALVSQGCKAFGPTMVVTRARGNILLELGGRPALDAVRDAVLELPEGTRKQLERGLFVGRVINEYKERFGRDDFLIRGVRGFDESARAVITDDFFRVGQTVRLHMRDARTADEDLAMLLDAQKLRPEPEACLLLAGNGRGSRLFTKPHHDARAVGRAFGPPDHGTAKAKSGEEIRVDAPPTVPLAGMFAAGEIGPVGGESFLHSQTACMAVFRRPVAADDQG
ncbi:MAG: FIST signal transduction protein [Phycisphaerales bacterium]